MNLWKDALRDNPLIAILRGLEPDHAVEVADTLVDAGFRIIEVPLNSLNPLTSIERIAAKHGSHIVVGAGTVLTTQDVGAVVDAGGQIIVAPNMNPAVGACAVELGTNWCPGVITPTEAFSALELGASMLKLFPAELVPPKAVAAMRAVLPTETVIAAVGGITLETMQVYRDAGTDSFGLGSALFKPSYDLGEIAQRAKAFVDAFEQGDQR
jgi:2-dehydro-3-deoxyphosphogalactonate aldolase